MCDFGRRFVSGERRHFDKELYMNACRTLGFSVAALIVGAMVAGVQGGTGTATNVTSHLVVPGDSLAPVFFSDAAISGTDAYITTAGKASVSSLLQPGGDWQLDTQSSARAVWLDLGDASLPWASATATGQYVHSLLTTHCASTNATPVAALTAVGSSTNCGMSFRINWGSVTSVFYRIHFNSVLHPGTGDVKFTCNQVGSNSCDDWTASPADDDSLPGDGRSTGLLVKVTTTHSGETETTIGYYQVNFSMHITKP
jgi:hypothetical protein